MLNNKLTLIYIFVQSTQRPSVPLNNLFNNNLRLTYEIRNKEFREK